MAAATATTGGGRIIVVAADRNILKMAQSTIKTNSITTWQLFKRTIARFAVFLYIKYFRTLFFIWTQLGNQISYRNNGLFTHATWLNSIWWINYCSEVVFVKHFYIELNSEWRLNNTPHYECCSCFFNGRSYLFHSIKCQLKILMLFYLHDKGFSYLSLPTSPVSNCSLRF